jgi:asparagine synthase (glutamine-hydrolysing)
VLRPFAGLLDPERGCVLRLGAAEATVTDEVLCALDGAVYNCEELAAELRLPPELDPQQILARGFRRWGSGLAPRLRGEFALLLWDRRERRGILAPDQIGIRRVVFRRRGNRLWFATEIRHLLPLLERRPGPDPVAVSHWLTARQAPRWATLYEGIECPGPGWMLELDRDGGRPHRYWRPQYREPVAVGEAELVERVGAGLRTAVARRVPAADPVGVLMSGGLDSTSVALLAQRASDSGAWAFSSTFPEFPQVDESPWIDAVEAHSGLPAVRLAAEPQGIVASGLEHLATWELPLHAWNEAWTQPLMREAAALGVTAILSGEGGDELFGSRCLLIADLLRSGHLLAAARLARGLPEAGGRAPRRVFAEILWRFGLAGLPSARLESAWRRCAFWEDRAPWWAQPQMERWLRSERQPSWRALDGPRWWAHLADVLTDSAHGFGLFDHMRRSAEQAGLEARQPLFDLDLLELMLAVPPAVCSRGSLTRPLLRAAMSGLSPDSVRLRPDKSVFDELVSAALLGPELPALRQLLGNASEVRAYARPEAIADLLAHPPPHQRGEAAAWEDDVLRLTAIELWLRFQEDPDLPARLLEGELVPPPRHRLVRPTTAPGPFPTSDFSPTIESARID